MVRPNSVNIGGRRSGTDVDQAAIAVFGLVDAGQHRTGRNAVDTDARRQRLGQPLGGGVKRRLADLVGEIGGRRPPDALVEQIDDIALGAVGELGGECL